MAKRQDTSATYRRILGDLQKGNYKPFYLLMGAESYYIDSVSKYIAANALSEDEKAFNQLVLYGNDVSTASVIDQAKRYPMMAARQVIIVREAQNLKQWDLFASYLKAPQTSTVLVLCHMGKSVDKRTAFYKTATASSIVEVLESEPIREEETAGWIDNYSREQALDIEPEASRLLADYLGTDLNRIVMEIEKLRILLPKDNNRITARLIEESVGVNREYSPFTLCKYISSKDFSRIQTIATYMGQNSKNYPLVVMVSVLQMHFTRILKYHALRSSQPQLNRYSMAPLLKINPYFMAEVETAARNFPMPSCVNALRLIRDTDSRFKSNERGTATEGELLMELLCKIMML